MAAAEPPRIRVAGPTDGEACGAIYAPIVRDTVISMEAAAPDADAMAARIAETLRTHPWLVAEQAGTVLGYAYASPHRSRAGYRWAADVSAYVAEPARGQGLGRALYEALFALLKRQGFHTAWAGIALPNAASVGLHEALGFTPVAVYPRVGFKLGRWVDVGWWGLALQPATTADGPTPPEPIPFPDLTPNEPHR